MMTDTKKIFSNAVILFTLLEMCHCVTVYNLNRAGPKPYDDDGTYRTTEHDNDETFYRFGYKVNAVETGDIKQHTETRVKDDVKGAYFLIEPNGVIRIVEYVANSNGFNAVVRQQFGDKYSKNLDKNESTQSDPFRQAFHTNILNESKANNEENLSQKQQKVMAVDRFLQEPIDKYSQQIGTYRQSSPKSITNQSSIRLPETSSGEQSATILSDSAAQPASTTPPPVMMKGRRRQYEVIDPEIDIDIRRMVPKLFLNLDKLKQARMENNK